MKRRALFEKAAQVAAALGLGGAAALAGAKPSDAFDRDVFPSGYDPLRCVTRFPGGSVITDEQRYLIPPDCEDDLYSALQHFKDTVDLLTGDQLQQPALVMQQILRHTGGK